MTRHYRVCNRQQEIVGKARKILSNLSCRAKRVETQEANVGENENEDVVKTEGELRDDEDSLVEEKCHEDDKDEHG